MKNIIGTAQKVHSIDAHLQRQSNNESTHKPLSRPAGSSCDTSITFRSAKNDLQWINCFTLPEVQACLFLEFMPHVISYERFEAPPNGAPDLHPNFLARMHLDDGSEKNLVIKVVSAARRSTQAGRNDIEALARGCRARGFIFVLFTERTLSRQLSTNFRRLYFARLRHHVTDDMRAHVFGRLLDWEEQSLTFEYAFDYFRKRPDLKAALCDLLVNGDAIANLSEPVLNQCIRTPVSET